MSNRVLKDCMRVVGITPAQKAVLMCLADHANDAGECWPSIPRIELWTCLGRTAVMEAQKALEQLRIVAVVRQFGRSNGFRINVQSIKESWPAPVRHTDPQQSGRRTRPDSGPVREPDHTRPDDGPSPVRETDVTRPAAGPESSGTINTEPPGKHQGESARNAPDEFADLLQGVDPKDLSDWSKVRKAKRQPITRRALEGIQREAAKAGMTIEQAITICAERSWAGFNASWDWHGASRSTPPRKQDKVQKTMAGLGSRRNQGSSNGTGEIVDV